MGLVDLIEKLINEHGSAEIMEKRLVLFKEQATAIDQRNSKLESENAEVRRALEAVTKERDQLRAHLAQITKSNELDETEKNLLKVLTTIDGVSAKTLATQAGTDLVRAEYYLHKLEQEEYIYGQHFMGGASLYSLAQRGREFLIKNQLI
jgi:predicted transcriptional regulator